MLYLLGLRKQSCNLLEPVKIFIIVLQTEFSVDSGNISKTTISVKRHSGFSKDHRVFLFRKTECLALQLECNEILLE